MRPQERTDGMSMTSSRRPVEAYLEAADIDDYHDQLKKRRVRDVAHYQMWGDRAFTVMDPFWFRISYVQQVGEPNPPIGRSLCSERRRFKE
jgi:hypothetical protein